MQERIVHVRNMIMVVKFVYVRNVVKYKLVTYAVQVVLNNGERWNVNNGKEKRNEIPNPANYAIRMWMHARNV